jgi:hypothetical protein
LDAISSYELHEWAAFYTIEAEDERAAYDAAKPSQRGDEDV